MKDIHVRLADLGLIIPEILLPHPGINIEKWAVIACDQFTQDTGYWEKVKNFTAGSPSTLNLILPEAYLDKGGNEARNNAIHLAMKSYLQDGVLSSPRRCGVYLERNTPFNQKRRVLILAIDLEQYDWRPQARPLIRATEGTVKERLPPRMQIRRNAPLETSHTLLLIDDEEDSLIPGLGKEAAKNPPLYSSPLMMNSGSVSGWALDTEESWALLADGLEKLAEKSLRRYGIGNERHFLFAVGDGNHSLAAAKGAWDEYKAAHPDESAHPCRYALVELVNLHDPGLSFRPIHMVFFGAEPSDLLEGLSALPGFSYQAVKSGEAGELLRIIEESGGPKALGQMSLGLIASGKEGLELGLINAKIQGIAAAKVQPLLDDLVSQSGNSISMDFIHGEEELIRIVMDSAPQWGGKLTGLVLPPIYRDGLFKTINQGGPLPRKSFSMGESIEKRFYLECRKLSPP